MRSKVVDILSRASELPKSEVEMLLEVPTAEKFGDYSFPCYKLAAVKKKDPKNMAEDIAKKIKDSLISKVEVKGAYVNLFFDDGAVASRVLKEIQTRKNKYGAGKRQKQRLMIEFSQPNTHKPFHIGHFRGTCLGDSLVWLEKFYGYPVISANYIGDIGKHVAKWIWFFTEFYNKKIPNRNIGNWLGEIYALASSKLEGHEEYEKEVDSILRRLETRDKKLTKIWRETRNLSLYDFKDIYKELGVRFDVWFYESEVEKEGKKIAYELLERGVAKRDHGATLVDLSKYGLDVYLILKSDSSSLYSTKDIALAKRKFERFKIDESIYITGAEQVFYFKQLFKTLELMGFKQAKNCHHIPYGLILLQGKKMASRAGEVVSFSDLFESAKKKAEQEIVKRNPTTKSEIKSVADKIALAALKYEMLKHSSEKTINFDWDEALNFEGNTGPYLQYALVRANRILDKVGKFGKLNTKLLLKDEEKKLIRELAKFPDVVEKAARQYQPHIVADYAFELANTFSLFYERCPVVNADNELLKNARAHLVKAFAQTLKNILSLLRLEEVWLM